MNEGIFRFGECTLDAARRELHRDGHPVALPSRVFDCLVYLIRHRDRAVGRDELISAVFGRVDVSDAQLGQMILRARRAVADDGREQQAIRTIPRFGFRWVAEVSVEAEPSRRTPIGHDMQGPPHGAGTSAAPVAPRPPGRRRGVAVVAAITIAAALAGAAAWHHAIRPSDAAVVVDARLPVAVLPTRVEGAPADDWASYGLMDYIGGRLRAAGLSVVPSDTTLALLDHGQGDEPLHVRRVTGAGHVVRSSATRRGATWTVRLDAEDGDGLQTRSVGRDADPIAAARLAVDRLLATLGRQAPDDAAEPGPTEAIQRAQAAMLANALDQARAILASAAERRPDVGLLRYHLLQVDFREGRYEHALGAIEALLGDSALAEDAALHARLLNARGAIGIRLDRYPAAEQDFLAALSLLDPARDPSEWSRSRAGLGIARMAQGRTGPAAEDLAAARRAALRAGDAVAVARVDSHLGHLERARERHARALDHFASAARDFESLGAFNELLSTQAMVVDTHLQLLQNAQADIAMQRYWALRSRVRDPAQRALIDLTRIRVLLRFGRLREAEELMNPPRRDARPTAQQLHQYALHRVEHALLAGRPAVAFQHAESALALGNELSQPVRDWLLLRREQAAAVGDAAPSASIAVGSRAEDASVPRALAEALALARSRQHDAADAAYARALEAALESRTPALLVEVAACLVPWWLDRGRPDDASSLAERVAPWGGTDFRAARVLAAVHAATGRTGPLAEAAADVRRLAAERSASPSSSACL